jgi:hypothetical protein
MSTCSHLGGENKPGLFYLFVFLQNGVGVTLPRDACRFDFLHPFDILGKVAAQTRIDGRVVHWDKAADEFGGL